MAPCIVCTYIEMHCDVIDFCVLKRGSLPGSGGYIDHFSYGNRYSSLDNFVQTV
jgi:hypothetical protein